MTAAEFFQQVVKANCKDARDDPGDYRHIWDAIVAMNTVAEYLALDRAGGVQMSRQELDARANQIREKTEHLSDLKFCAESLKHVRKIEGGKATYQTVATSTAVRPEDLTTWQVGPLNLNKTMEDALAELETFPELGTDPS